MIELTPVVVGTSGAVLFWVGFWLGSLKERGRWIIWFNDRNPRRAWMKARNELRKAQGCPSSFSEEEIARA